MPRQTSRGRGQTSGAGFHHYDEKRSARSSSEALTIIAEGIAQRASDVDAVWLNGYGWPRWTGGPLFRPDRIGRHQVAHALRRIGHEPATSL